MKIRNWLLGLVVLFAGIGAWAQTLPTTNYTLPNIAAIRTQVISPSTYGSINVAGFYTANDGGGGQFNAVTGCSFTATGSIVQSGSLTMTLSAPNSAIIPGMGINNSSGAGFLPPGETVAAVSGTTVTLAQAALQATTGATFYFGGNGGTVIMDGTTTATPNCFQRQNYTGDVRQFGAKCDVVYATGDGSVTGGSKQFTSTQVTFSNADIGKVIELNYAGGTNPPFATTIASINNNTGAAVLAVASPNAFPGIATATAANMNIPPYGADTPGSGWEPGNAGVDSHVSNGAQVQVFETGVVQFSGYAGGSGYQVNDILYGTGNSGTGIAKQRAPVQVQVMSVSPLTGGITSYAIVFSGLYALIAGDTTDANPSAFTWTGGHGTGFGVTLFTNNGSFGVANVILTAGGQYNTPPANPVTMTETNCSSCTGTGLSVDLALSTADWSYGTDDTAALQNTENYAETYPTTMRGLTGAVHVPAAMCYASGLVINRPVAWRGAGPRQSRLIQILGSPGLSVNGSLPAFVTAAVAYPPGDDYDSVSTRFGQPITTFEDLALWGSNPQTTAQVGSTTQTNQSAGLVLTNPVADQFTDVPVYLSNVEVQRFPNHLLSASQWPGTFRAYHVNLLNGGATLKLPIQQSWQSGATTLSLSSTQGLFPGMSVYIPSNGTATGIPPHETITQVSANSVTLALPTTASGSGALNFVSGNCLDLHDVINPSHFYGLVTAHCNIGIHIDSGAEYEFHGWVGFSNNINVAVSGSGGAPGETIAFYGAQFQLTNQENLYLDQRNQAVVCFMCKFQKSASAYTDSDGNADVVISPSAGSGAPGSLYPVLQMSAPQFGTTGRDTPAFKNILFDATGTSTNTYCTCRVTLDGLSVDYDFDPHGASVPSTNLPSQILAGNLFAPLQFTTGTGTTVLETPSSQSAFNWNLPAVSGLPSQDLNSGGGGMTAMSWGGSSRLISNIGGSASKTFTATNGGSGNWNVNFAYDLWDIERSGNPTTGLTDIWDTAANIITAVNNGGSIVSVGQRFNVVVCNATAQTDTLQPGTGDTPVGVTSVPAGQCGHFVLLVTNTGSNAAITIVGG